jgi:phage regulator Rha-like protein
MREAKDWWSEVMEARLRSQIVTLERGQHIKYRPYAFTEHGILMLSSILNSERAVQVNIQIMRAFIRLRQMLATNANLERRLNELEKKYDAQFKAVFDAIRQLMAPPPSSRKKIGFHLRERRVAYGKR